MGKPKKKAIIGILGGVGSGKSTVAAEFAKLGCGVIDADEIAHDLLDRKTIKKTIVASFGRAVLDPEGKVDRKALSDIVFADADKLSTLNRIIHPAVLRRAEQLIERMKGQKRVKAIVLDMPLLVEVGWAKRCDSLVFVDCKRKLRVERAKKMGFFDKNRHKIRENLENFQISLDKKVNIAENIINNNSGFSSLARQVAEVFSYIMYNG